MEGSPGSQALTFLGNLLYPDTLAGENAYMLVGLDKGKNGLFSQKHRQKYYSSLPLGFHEFVAHLGILHSASVSFFEARCRMESVLEQCVL